MRSRQRTRHMRFKFIKRGLFRELNHNSGHIHGMHSILNENGVKVGVWGSTQLTRDNLLEHRRKGFHIGALDKTSVESRFGNYFSWYEQGRHRNETRAEAADYCLMDYLTNADARACYDWEEDQRLDQERDEI